MSIVIEKNDMGGKSVYVGSVKDLAKVPTKHRRLVGRAQLLALADPPRFFHDLAGRAKRRPLRQWLKILADCANCFLELHTASSASFPGFPSAAYFRFILDNGSAPAVKLRSAQAIPSLPPALAEVYELSDGINHCGYGMGGLCTNIHYFSRLNVQVPDFFVQEIALITGRGGRGGMAIFAVERV